MKKKVFIFLTSIILILVIMFPITKTQADSGFDSSYGGGSSGGSSWSGGSSGGGGFIFNDYPQIDMFIITTMIVIMIKDKLPHKSGIIKFVNFIRIIIFIGSFYIDSLIFINLIIMFASIIIAADVNARKIKDKYKYNQKNIYYQQNKYDDIVDDKLIEYGIVDKEQLKQELYKKYKEIQLAWMNIEYDKLRNLLSDSLYNMYKSQLKTLELKNQKNIMSDFEYIDSKIIGLEKINNNIELKLYLNVKMYDYIVNIKNNLVLKGSKRKKIDISYEITFEKTCLNKPKICPNCGAPITNNASNKCEYCDSVIVSDNHDWVMSKKICVKQK